MLLWIWFSLCSITGTHHALLSLAMVSWSLLSLTTMAIHWKRFLLIKERSVRTNAKKFLIFGACWQAVLFFFGQILKRTSRLKSNPNAPYVAYQMNLTLWPFFIQPHYEQWLHVETLQELTNTIKLSTSLCDSCRFVFRSVTRCITWRKIFSLKSTGMDWWGGSK